MDALNQLNTATTALEFVFAHAARDPDVLEKLLDDKAQIETVCRSSLESGREFSDHCTKKELTHILRHPFEPPVSVNTIEQFQITQNYITPNNSWALLIVQSEWNEQDTRKTDKVLKTCNNFLLSMAMTDEGVKITKACLLKYQKPDFTTLAPGI